MTTQTSTLHTASLMKNFGKVRALRGVTLDIPSGQTVAIMGPSGSGKSTLLHCLAGIMAPSSGTVFLGNTEISALSDAKRSKLRLARMGFVFQDGQLIPELPARENVAVPLMLGGTRRGNALKVADEWLARLGVDRERKRQPGEMSGGQMQRVAIARALAGSPAVVFADEPTGALDQSTGHEVMQILTTTVRMSGATLVMVTHDPKVAQWCDRLVEIRDGVVHADSQPNAANAPEQPGQPGQPNAATQQAAGGQQ
ncbi:ABC transporter ATP-binding protein [Actinobaculum suis]|uniref:ABC transporter ATP-binding protein n=1 Tax=Actinobaculum suis TaxID=1657 RepID=UPI0009F16262|nr:ABC transporter ATP-binding protein [Actinobaculum suis]